MADRQGQSASPSRGGVFTGPSSTSTFNGSTGGGGTTGGVTAAQLAAEIAARILGDDTNAANITAEAVRAMAAEAAERARAMLVEQSLADQIQGRQVDLVAGDGISLVDQIQSEDALISVDATIARQADFLAEVARATAAELANMNAISAEAARALAAELANTTLIGTKQNTLIAGTNITIVDGPNPTSPATINAVQLGDIFELGIILDDPDPRVIEHSDPLAPTVTVIYSNLTTSAPGQIFVSSTAGGSTPIPTNAKVEVNGIEFVRTVDYTLNNNTIVFPLTPTSGYTILQGDQDFIRIYL